MPHIRINVDGAPGDVADLYDELKSTRLTRDVELTPVSSRDGTLGLFESILAVVNTVAAAGGLIVAILQWRQNRGTSVRITLDEGRSAQTMEVENADDETIELVWKLLERPKDD